MLLTLSDIRTFKACRRRWFYSSPLGYGKQLARRESPYLLAGSIAHEALAKYHSGASKVEVLTFLGERIAQTKGRQQEEIVKVRGSLDYYMDWTRRWFPIAAREMEREVVLDLGDDLTYAGRIDGIADIQGERWLLEFKTCSSFPDTKVLSLDEQATAYLWAYWKITGIQARGMHYLLIRKTAPASPPLLSSGELSRAQATLNNTTYDLYLEAIQQNNLVRSDYREELGYLVEANDPTVRIVSVKKPKVALLKFEAEIRMLAIEMQRDCIYPSPNWFSCKYCDYRAACYFESNGLSPDIILNGKDYEPVKERYGSLEEES